MNFDCTMFIGGVDMLADLVWYADCRITYVRQYAYREIMNTPATYDATTNCIEADTDKAAPCEYDRYDESGSIHREAYRRMLRL